MNQISAMRCDQGFMDPKLQIWTIPVLPGEQKVITGNEPAKTVALQTLLGSCVAACIRDKKSGLGGLNHFLLPSEKGPSDGSASSRYGIHAMELLINSILKMGALKIDLEAKVFGGANVLHGVTGAGVGEKNAQFVLKYLKDEQISVAASDLGGDRARKIYFIPETGRVLVQNLSPSVEKTALELEKKYSTQLPEKPKSGQVDLF